MLARLAIPMRGRTGWAGRLATCPQVIAVPQGFGLVGHVVGHSHFIYPAAAISTGIPLFISIDFLTCPTSPTSPTIQPVQPVQSTAAEAQLTDGLLLDLSNLSVLLLACGYRAWPPL